jgi:hypothetical protein
MTYLHGLLQCGGHPVISPTFKLAFHHHLEIVAGESLLSHACSSWRSASPICLARKGGRITDLYELLDLLP